MGGQGDLLGNPESGTVTHHGIAEHGDKLAIGKSIDLPGQWPLGIAIHAGALVNAATELDNAGDIRERGIANVEALIRIGKRGTHRHLGKGVDLVPSLVGRRWFVKTNRLIGAPKGEALNHGIH